MRKRILLVGDYNRNDFLYVAKLLHAEIDFYFIEFLNEHFLKSKECLKYGQVIYWKDYKNAYDLLEKISPEKIIFYFIESYNHAALNVAAKTRYIPTYHLEHGVRFNLGSFLKEKSALSKAFNKLKILGQFSFLHDRYASRRFFQSTVKNSSKSEGDFLSSYYAIRKKHSIRETFRRIKDPLKLPGRYISFSPLIFEYHKNLENVPENYPVSYIGIPFFDHFFKWNSLPGQGENILFIDQPLHESKLLGWTKEHKENFFRHLIAMARSMNKKLYLKPHPLNDQLLYQSFCQDIIKVEDNWETVIPDIDVVLGFSSTLLMPFMAMDRVTCFTLEIHPQKINPKYSDFLLRSGACHAANDFEDLQDKFREQTTWHQKQKEHKNYFIENWMYCFDGKSSERLRKVLIGNEAV